MAWFFTDDVISGENYIITGETAKHISKSLRMKCAEQLTLCSADGTQHNCIIESIQQDAVTVKILESCRCEQEPDVKITLFQALPKGDKMEYIIQKAVELGVTQIVPFISSRCISRPDKKSLEKKTQRWQKIAKSAAEQSRRGIIPTVCDTLDFTSAVQEGEKSDRLVIFYEGGGERVSEILDKTEKSVAVFIGSEGGFDEKEVEKIISSGGKAATLGKRILRAETAPLAAVAILMYETGNM